MCSVRFGGCVVSLLKTVRDLRRAGDGRGWSENVAFELRSRHGGPLGDVEEERTESVQGRTWSLVVTGA